MVWLPSLGLGYQCRNFFKPFQAQTKTTAMPSKRTKAAPEQSIGLSFENLFPKEAVRQFCDRYKAGRSTKEDFFYRHEHTDSGVVATLVTPLLDNREFRGCAAAEEKEAECSAADFPLQEARQEQSQKAR